jgi:short chain dehydrogenase
MITNVASLTAEQGYPYNSVYASSKAEVALPSESLNIELAEFGVIVRAVLPGMSTTQFFTKIDRGDSISDAPGPLLAGVRSAVLGCLSDLWKALMAKPGAHSSIWRSDHMPGPFIFVATNKVREGRLEGEKQRVPGWIKFIHSNEPRLLAFHEYLSEDGTEVEYVQVHPDTDSFEHHLRVVERSGRSYTETLDGTTNIRIYGAPSKAILEMLSQAAGSGVPTTVLPEHLGGFTR